MLIYYDDLMSHMRTTATLEADVEEKLREFMSRNRYTFKQALNETLRRGLGSKTTRPSKPFEVEARPMGVKPGIDLTRLNELADELEVDAFLEKERKLAERIAQKERGK